MLFIRYQVIATSDTSEDIQLAAPTTLTLCAVSAAETCTPSNYSVLVSSNFFVCF